MSERQRTADTLGISETEMVPLGAVADDGGSRVAVFSTHAEQIDVCVFDDADREVDRSALTRGAGGVWSANIACLRPGMRYGLRADGPYDPASGHRFNVQKLLIDPYAQAVAGRVTHHDALSGDNPQDSAPFVPKSVVVGPDTFDWGDDTPPAVSFDESVIYEAHVKNLTVRHPDVPDPLRGTYEGLACPAIIDHLANLGVTAIELLPIHAFADERFLTERGLTNHWGYNTFGFFAPDNRYMGPMGADGLKAAIKAFHAAGIEVLLDVVYNHTAESNANGPTLMFRGLDNAAYYRLEADGGYVNDTGCGNTVRCDHPMVMRLIIDSLRHWVETYHVDGFRFDLASVLGRTGAGGFAPDAPLLKAMRTDPVLNAVKLIAEPWDVGPGGYRLGQFPNGFGEWNDRFRDDVRTFWRGDQNTGPAFAARLMGSADVFDRRGRRPCASVNAVATHDGFTLRDLVTYNEKHNHANAEDNRDGHSANHSSNGGVEGPTDDPAILAARDLRRRNLIASVLLAQGTPMILAGDEVGHSQDGNNNAYCQDNPLSWIDWSAADSDFKEFVACLIGLRRNHPALRQSRFLHGDTIAGDRLDVSWIGFDGVGLTWEKPDFRQFACRLVHRSAGATGDQVDDVIVAVNGHNRSGTVSLPDPAPYAAWALLLSTSDPSGAHRHVAGANLTVDPESIVILVAAGSAPP